MDNITFIILILTITVAVVVRFLMFSKPFSKEAIEEKQKDLDGIIQTAKKIGYSLEKKDAEEYMLETRDSIKGFMLFILACILSIIFFIFFRESDEILSLGASVLFLGCYGLAVASPKGIIKALMLGIFIFNVCILLVSPKSGNRSRIPAYQIADFYLFYLLWFFLLLEIKPKEEKRIISRPRILIRGFLFKEKCYNERVM